MRSRLLPIMALALAALGVVGFRYWSESRNLRARLGDHAPGSRWIWNDWEVARDDAKKSGKPVFVLFRCVP